jgi:hypothetical protein
MSASLRSNPNLRPQRIDAVCQSQTHAVQQKAYSITSSVLTFLPDQISATKAIPAHNTNTVPTRPL